MRLARFIIVVSALTLVWLYRWSIYGWLGVHPNGPLDFALLFCAWLLILSPFYLFVKRPRNAIPGNNNNNPG